MTLTLRLDPAIAAARRLAKVAPTPTAPTTAPPDSPAQAPSAPGKKAQKNALQDRLKLSWPHLFATHPHPPLAIGIRDDIARHLSADEVKLLSDVLRRWVARPAYLKACAEPGAHRVDLAGNLTPLTEKEVAYARTKLAERATTRRSVPA